MPTNETPIKEEQKILSYIQSGIDVKTACLACDYTLEEIKKLQKNEIFAHKILCAKARYEASIQVSMTKLIQQGDKEAIERHLSKPIEWSKYEDEE